MTGYALTIAHRTKPGRREEVHRVWRRHMLPAIAANPGHRAYFYCFGPEPDTIVAFQHYADAAAGRAFLQTPDYGRYLAEVTPLLEGKPTVTVLDVRWTKPRGVAEASSDV